MSSSSSCGRTHWPRSNWIDKYGDLDGDGFVEYRAAVRPWSRQPGLEGLGRFDPQSGRHARRWRRSRSSRCRATSMPHDGAWPDWRACAATRSLPSEQEHAAERLRRSFEEHFWMSDARHVRARARRRQAPGRRHRVERRPRAVGRHRVAGARRERCASADQRRDVERLGHPDAVERHASATTRSATTSAPSGRTTTASVRPASRVTDCSEEARKVAGALLEATMHFREARLPELFCGFDRDYSPLPVPYPVACSPQAWAAGSLFHMVAATLGMQPGCARQQPRAPSPGTARLAVRPAPAQPARRRCTRRSGVRARDGIDLGRGAAPDRRPRRRRPPVGVRRLPCRRPSRNRRRRCCATPLRG